MSSTANNAIYGTIERGFYEILFQSLFYGVFCVLMAASTFILLRQGIFRTRANFFMFSVTIVMFIAGTLSEVLSVALLLKSIQATLSPGLATPGFIQVINIITVVGACSVRVGYVLSDVVVVWRAWIVCGRQRGILVLLSLFLLGSIAAAGVNLGLSTAELFQKSDNFDNDSPVKTGERAMVLVLPTLATNIFSTSLILYRAWQHRQCIKADVDDDYTATKVGTILFWLIESATVYCLIWVLYVLAYFQLFSRIGLYVMDAIMVQIVGIYPTMIIILVALNKSRVDRYSTYDAGNSMRFATRHTAVSSATREQRSTVHEIHPNFQVSLYDSSPDVTRTKLGDSSM